MFETQSTLAFNYWDDCMDPPTDDQKPKKGEAYWQADSDDLTKWKSYTFPDNPQGNYKWDGQDVSIRKVGNIEYLYLRNRNDRLLQCGKSGAFIFLNLVHNIFIKCLKVLFITLFSAMGVKFKEVDIRHAKNMWKGASPIKALLVLIPQLILNVLGFISCGLFSTELNRLSGDLERWALGDSHQTIVEQTRPKRGACKSYIAICEQPLCVVDTTGNNRIIKKELLETEPLKGRKLPTEGKTNAIYFKCIVPRPFWRTILPVMMESWETSKNIQKRYDNLEDYHYDPQGDV